MNGREKQRNPSVASGDSSPNRGAFSVEASPLRGGGAKRRRGLFTIENVRNRGLIWDGHSLAYNPNLVEMAKALRKEMTKAERKLWYDFLRNHPKRFYRQRPIDHFIADFYCSECALIIEIDGSQHYTPEGLKRDAVRTDILSLYGLQILRFTNKEVLEEFETVCAAIQRKIQETPQSSPTTAPLTGEPFP